MGDLKSRRCQAALGAIAFCLVLPSGSASAQSTDTAAVQGPADSGAEIVVTARRRDESLQSVPVTVSAVTGEMLGIRGITNLEGFARMVPQLFLANSSGGLQGGAIGLRGISAGDGNGFGDQAVSFNIDGVQIARATPRTLSEFDIEQMEVMKGPQALFFGKNSPGGVIAIHSADPGDHLEAGGKLSYEANAEEVRGETYISGPLGEGFGARLALSAAAMRGWAKNITTQGTIYSPARQHSPRSREFNARVTLKHDDGGPFSARLKVSYGKISNDGPAANNQRVYCPLGAPQLGGPDDCAADDRVVRANLGARLGSGGTNTVSGAPLLAVPQYGNGVPYGRTRQVLSGLELKYALNDILNVASTSGFYDARIRAVENFNAVDASYAVNPALSPAAVSGLFASYFRLGITEVSEELRLTSDFAGPVNFMIGGYFQDQKLSTETAASANALNPVQFFAPARMKQRGVAASGFASLSYRPLASVELSGGARYSYERKKFELFRLLDGTLPASVGGGAFVAGQGVPTTVPERTFRNWSPEATLTWRPADDITAFAGWRRGFLSGGYNAGGTGTNVPVIPDRSYDQEVVEGWEGGIKTTFLRGRARFNVSAYSYTIKGLQVTSVLPGPPPVQVINNAATARSKGFEAEAELRLLSGLALRGSISYNDARYSRFATSPCWGGQSIALGCDGNFNGTAFTTQDLSGAPLVRSPKWAGSIGATYDLEMANGDALGFAIDGNYTSSFFTEALNAPGGMQHGYWLLDASARYKISSGLELALIGRNLTGEYYFQRSTAAPFTGGPSGVATTIEPDQIAYVSRGRELRLQIGFRF